MSEPRIDRREGWLLFDAATASVAHRRDPGALLCGAARLVTPCKLAVGARGTLRVRAELRADAASPARVAAVEREFAAVADWLAGGALTVPDALASDPGAPVPDLAALCADEGWPFDARAGGELAVDLGVRDAYFAARFSTHADRIELACEIVPAIAARGPCREAVAVLALAANAAFRMVRVVWRGDALPGAWIEVPLPRDASDDELRHALRALGVAARHFAREARALAAHEPLARAFLSQRRPRGGRKQGGRTRWQQTR